MSREPLTINTQVIIRISHELSVHSQMSNQKLTLHRVRIRTADRKFTSNRAHIHGSKFDILADPALVGNLENPGVCLGLHVWRQFIKPLTLFKGGASCLTTSIRSMQIPRSIRNNYEKRTDNYDNPICA